MSYSREDKSFIKKHFTKTYSVLVMTISFTCAKKISFLKMVWILIKVHNSQFFKHRFVLLLSRNLLAYITPRPKSRKTPQLLKKKTSRIHLQENPTFTQTPGFRFPGFLFFSFQNPGRKGFQKTRLQMGG